MTCINNLTGMSILSKSTARLAQSAERKALNLVVVGSSPTVGAFSFCTSSSFHMEVKNRNMVLEAIIVN